MFLGVLFLLECFLTGVMVTSPLWFCVLILFILERENQEPEDNYVIPDNYTE